MAVTPRMAASMAKQGIAPSGGPSSPSPSPTMGGGVNAAGQLLNSSGTAIGKANPKDLPGYNAIGDPTSKVNPTPASMPEGEISTAQPNPKTVNAMPFTGTPQSNMPAEVSYEQAQANLNKGGLTGTALASAQQTLKQKYQKGVQDLNASGAQAPVTIGAGSAGVRGTIASPEEEEVSPLANIMGTDSNFDGILTSYDEFFNPNTQRVSLLDEYKKLSGSLGIDNLNAELIDAKRIIEGTEDDIRSEVTATGGMATDSQVLAMANARNKSLVKNYNYLLDSRNNAMTQLNTMMDLSIKDRQMAEADFDRKLNFGFKVAEFKERAKKNALDTYTSLGDKMGWDTLLESVSPYEKSVIQKTMGVSMGALDNLASVSAKKREAADTEAALDLQIKRANLNKLTAPKERSTEVVDVGGRKVMIDSDTGETIKEITAGGSTASKVGGSLINPNTGRPDPRNQISQVINNSGAKTDDKLKLTGAVISAVQDLAENNREGRVSGISPFTHTMPGFLRSSKNIQNQTYLSALEGTIESWMTGASVSEDQAQRIKKDMVPKKGDTSGTIRKKVNALANYMMSYTAGNLATQGVDWAPEKIDFFANPTVKSPTGEEIIIID